MRNVPIKFRGESAIGTVYGFYVEREGKPYIVNEYGTMISVDEESVCQLCGYLDSGEEVYEWDMLMKTPIPYVFRAQMGDDLSNTTGKLKAGEKI